MKNKEILANHSHKKILMDDSERESSKVVCLNRGLFSEKSNLRKTHFDFSTPHLA
jgi:hypothetical protein